ncbi:MAG: energy-coupling factor ABC transporter ATP-binding protein [Chloroflexi bacterium]|nr:energy-coupling factor ABC transporter ATP-binding protein [Chloroflexota bacterium]MCI0575567.1 energy-coupling factor ABC transporter ATP-binding protein [Chloroflexota bacterium]MCI0649776.1 energy-coupling factor ABC transporter ATP-binding protein [Chloroflexota bacterium]MCI0726927.1 energy-coupling factor ABC transporter ATP-binding protein [Chloroflexota bacterium]
MNLSLTNVSFTYPSSVVALRGVSLAITAGESVALVGQNGAGKTTLARHLNGLLKPTTGQVSVGDWDTRQRTVAQLARRVGYVFQNPDEQLFAQTVQDEVAFGPRNLGRLEEEVKAQVNRALEQVGLAAEARHHPYDLQPSQRKLVALAAVLAMQTPVVILDEPTTGQDAPGVARLGELVETLKGEGRTVLAISHDLDFCAEHFARVVVMSQGQVLADGPAGQVLAQENLLAETDVEPPQLIRLAAALKLPDSPLTVEAFLATLALQRGQEAYTEP